MVAAAAPDEATERIRRPGRRRWADRSPTARHAPPATSPPIPAHADRPRRHHPARRAVGAPRPPLPPDPEEPGARRPAPRGRPGRRTPRALRPRARRLVPPAPPRARSRARRGGAGRARPLAPRRRRRRGAAGWPVVPVHPVQLAHLRARPETARLLADGALVELGEHGGEVYPTSSVRTVCDPDFPTTWKLPLHVRITNFVRTVPPGARRCGPRTPAASSARCAPGWTHPGFGVLVETGWRGADPASWSGRRRRRPHRRLPRAPAPSTPSRGCSPASSRRGRAGEEPSWCPRSARLGLDAPELAARLPGRLPAAHARRLRPRRRRLRGPPAELAADHRRGPARRLPGARHGGHPRRPRPHTRGPRPGESPGLRRRRGLAAVPLPRRGQPAGRRDRHPRTPPRRRTRPVGGRRRRARRVVRTRRRLGARPADQRDPARQGEPAQPLLGERGESPLYVALPNPIREADRC